jgi:hypothetical protein
MSGERAPETSQTINDHNRSPSSLLRKPNRFKNENFSSLLNVRGIEFINRVTLANDPKPVRKTPGVVEQIRCLFFERISVRDAADRTSTGILDLRHSHLARDPCSSSQRGPQRRRLCVGREFVSGQVKVAIKALLTISKHVSQRNWIRRNGRNCAAEDPRHGT